MECFFLGLTKQEFGLELAIRVLAPIDAVRNNVVCESM